MGCDPLHDQLLDGEDGIPWLWSNVDVFQSQVCEDGSVNFELDLKVLRVRDLLGNKMRESEKDRLVEYDS